VTAGLVALHGFSCAPSMWAEVLPEAETPALLGHAPTAGLDSLRPHAAPTAQNSLLPLDDPTAQDCLPRPSDVTPHNSLPPLAGGGSGWGAARGHSSGGYWAEVDRLARAVAERAGPGAHLVGYSMGARVALGLALRHPHLVAGLTLIGVNPGLEDEPARRERRSWEARWQRLLISEGIDAFADAWEALPLWQTQRDLPPERLARQRAARRAHDPRGLAAALETLGLGAMPNLWPELPRLQAPAHLIVGARDEKFARLAARVAGRAPNVRISLVPGAGHNPILEAPLELARLLHGDTHTRSNPRETKPFSA
jgi:2-succinyl-6-hydroxy-2,4-cyclohexadiene-1-carboxylate synthase